MTDVQAVGKMIDRKEQMRHAWHARYKTRWNAIRRARRSDETLKREMRRYRSFEQGPGAAP
jgi:hypothetical protein